MLVGGVWRTRMSTGEALEELRGLKSRLARLEAEVEKARGVAAILYGALNDASTVSFMLFISLNCHLTAFDAAYV